MFSVKNIIALGLGALLGIGIPLAAAVIFKLKRRKAWLPSVFIGAATFFVFAMILEQLLHSIMLPIVSGNTAAYCIYGILAAGIFEETGRFVAYKTLMKKHLSTDNAIYMGIGHGGFEALLLLGLNMFSYFIIALVSTVTGSTDLFTSQVPPEAAETLKLQLEAVSQVGIANVLLSMLERLIAMTLHICMSVWVYEAVARKGKLWLYPAAIAAHALFDLSAVLYQTGILTSLSAVYIPMTIFTGVIVFATVKMAKALS